MEHPTTSSERFEFPPIMVLMILVVAAMFGSFFGSSLAYLIAMSQGQDLVSLIASVQENMPLHTRNILRSINLASHFMTFTFSVLMVVIFLYRKDWLRFLKLNRQPTATLLIASCFFMMAVFPVAQFAYWLNQQIPLPEWASKMENSATGMLEGLMVMDSPWEFLFNLLVMAVLPAIGEELMFRGIIQQKLEEQTKKPHLAIWVTAIIFSAIHFQFEGFLARMVLGAGLGYLFFWSRNLWVPIAAHFLTNALQIFVRYFFGAKVEEMQAQAEEISSVPWASALIGMILIFLTGQYLVKSKKEPEGQYDYK